MDINLEENGVGKSLPTVLSCCSKKGCDKVFMRTKGQTAYEERTGILNGIYFCEDCNTADHCDDIGSTTGVKVRLPQIVE